MSKSKDLVRKGSFLVAISVVIKLIGMLYRIPLTNMLTDEGNGYYGLAFMVYSYFIILATTGASDAISRMVSERLARKRYADARQVFEVGIMTSGTIGLVSCLVLWFGADLIAGGIYKTPQASSSIRSLAPAIFLVSLSSVFRGLYQGMGEVRPTAYADLIDQVFHAGFSILLVWYVLRSADLVLASPQEASVVYSYASSQAAMSSFYGALGGFLFLFMIFLFFRARSVLFSQEAGKPTEKKAAIFRRYILLVIPIMLSASVTGLRELVDTAVFNALMAVRGHSTEFINMQRGMLTGKYNVLTNMPIAALATLTYVLVPGIARAITRKDYDSVQEHITILMKLVLFLSVPAAVGLSILGKPIVQWLFASAPEGGELLTFGSFIVCNYAVSQNASAILQGLGKITRPVRNALLSACISLPLLCFSILVLDLQVYAMILTSTVFSFFLAFFNIRSVLKFCQCRINILHLFATPVLCSACMGLCTAGSFYLLSSRFGSGTIAIMGSLLLSVAVYFILVLNGNWMSRSEIEDLPLGRLFVKLRFRK